VIKQFQGEWLGSLLSGFFESMGGAVRADSDALMFDDAIASGLADTVKDHDAKFPPEFRLSKSGRKKKRQPVEPLNGYTVVDLSTGIAGAYCTKLLADGGARLIKVQPPKGDPRRRWSTSGAAIAPGHDGALFSFLACSKHSVVADPDVNPADVGFVNDLLASADAVVWSRGSAVAEHRLFAPAEIRCAQPHLVVTSITPFGLAGPWRHRAATEFTLQAWSGGIVGIGRGLADRAPVFVGGQVDEFFAGAYAGAVTLASRIRQRDCGTGELVDLSMLEP
jgi:crotonobetainyl-CoA:carnitine CoA-transferase CaiB-like acyl-CoA transferase